MSRPIRGAQVAMKLFTVAGNIRNCIGGSIKTNAVHLRWVIFEPILELWMVDSYRSGFWKFFRDLLIKRCWTFWSSYGLYGLQISKFRSLVYAFTSMISAKPWNRQYFTVEKLKIMNWNFLDMFYRRPHHGSIHHRHKRLETGRANLSRSTFDGGPNGCDNPSVPSLLQTSRRPNKVSFLKEILVLDLKS